MKTKLTIESVTAALEKASGQPVKSAQLLQTHYTNLYKFIRKNPELLEVQKAYRSKAFQDLEQMTAFAVKTGYIQRSVLDRFGNITSAVELIPVDERSRLDAAFRLMSYYKNDAGLTDELNVNVQGDINVPVEAWLTHNSTPEITESL